MKHASIKADNTLDIKPLIAFAGESFEVCLEKELPSNLMGNNPYKFMGPAKLDATARYNEGSVEIKGNIIVPIKYVCSKCGAPFEENLFIDINEKIVENDDDEHFMLLGDLVDFNEIISQIVALNIPTMALCRKNCKGICPVCGKNRNEEDCSCQLNIGATSPFSYLKDKIK
ncbi:MAG: DUF177 domain-containing protein [Clostridia bacterium]|nr:DUF177 domain-containing protein [Clostridia bacterium]